MDQFEKPKNDEEIFTQCKQKYDLAMNMEKGYDAVVKNSEKITDFIAKTRKKYEHLELHDYKLYHILAGSNEISGTIKHFDLPEREFEKFLCDL